MKQLLKILLLFISINSFAQKGNATLYFKNGDTISGFGKLTGATYINFKKEGTTKYIKFSFDILEKADLKVDESSNEYITFRLLPIIKKNGKPKDASVLGELTSGNVNLYIKGAIKDIATFSQNSNSGGIVMTGTTSSTVHYFIKKESENEVVHLGSNFFSPEKLLRDTENIFSECKDVYQDLNNKIAGFNDITEVVEYYNFHCNK